MKVTSFRAPRPVSTGHAEPPIAPLSPFSSAYVLPAYGCGVLYHLANACAALGAGDTMGFASRNSELLFRETQQRGWVDSLAALGESEGLRLALPVVGGMVAGILLIKGATGYALADRLGSRAGKIMSGLDVAAAGVTVLSILPGLQSLGAVAGVGMFLAQAGVALGTDSEERRRLADPVKAPELE